MTSTTTAPATLADLADSWTIDASHTRTGFVARHAMVTKVRDAFNEFEGRTVVDADDFTRSTVNLTIKAASIDTRNEQSDGQERRARNRRRPGQRQDRARVRGLRDQERLTPGRPTGLPPG